jgi:putative ABC transport system ATP-binding protein
MSAESSILEFDRVNKTYFADGQAVMAVKDVSLLIPTAKLVALVGRSGCGKSTLLNLAGAMDQPTGGRVVLDGSATSEMDDEALTKVRREKVGFIFQSFQLMPTLSAVENVELPLLLAGTSASREKAEEALRWVEVVELKDRFPHQMSGGQMQRVAIARAMASRPKLLLADEPIGNLDSNTGEVVLKLLRRVVDELKTTILMATHSRESLQICDWVVRMKDGAVESIEKKEDAWAAGSRS